MRLILKHINDVSLGPNTGPLGQMLSPRIVRDQIQGPEWAQVGPTVYKNKVEN